MAGLGLVLALVVLEASLFAGRRLVDLVRERSVMASLGGPDRYRILCLGDSTTELGGDLAWPAQLQEVLNQVKPGRFTVINGGRTCSDTGHVAAHLQRNLDRYRPQLVVVMMGINERGVRMYRQVPTSGSWLFEHLRTYRLAALALWPLLGEETDGGVGAPQMYREPYTRRNFAAVARTLDRRGIPLVAMQYPLRPAAPLRELLRGLDGVLVVDNQAIFAGALRRGRYEDLFIDRFAGDFGHCTPRGHRLLAEHLASSLRRGKLVP